MIRNFFFIVSLLLARSVASQPTAPGQQDNSSATRAEAEKTFRAGEKFFRAGQYDQAAELFEQAFKHLSLPAIAFSAAQAHRLQFFAEDPRNRQQGERAVELYTWYLSAVKTGGRRSDAVSALAELEPILIKTAATPLREQKKETRLFVSADVDIARVSLNDGPAESLPLMKVVPPGRIKVEVSAPGYKSFSRTKDVFEFESNVVEATLSELPANVSIKNATRQEISVDGNPAFATQFDLPSGKHTVQVRRRGHDLWSQTVTLERGKKVSLNPDLSLTTQRKISYVVLGTGLASAIAGGVYWGLAARAGSQAEDIDNRREDNGILAPELARYQDLVEQHDSRRGKAIWLLGAGGGLLTVGTLLYFLDTPSNSGPERPRSNIAFDPQSRSITMAGEF